MSSLPNCVCCWEQCAAYYKAINASAGVNDVWKGKPAEICLEPSVACDGQLTVPTAAMYEAILRYFPSDPGKVGVQKNLFIYRHHFPRAMLELKQERGIHGWVDRPLTRAEVKKLEQTDQYGSRMGERSNSIIFLCKDRLTDPAKRAVFQGLYVQSPMETEKAVKEFIASFGSKRRMRAQMKKSESPPGPYVYDVSDSTLTPVVKDPCTESFKSTTPSIVVTSTASEAKSDVPKTAGEVSAVVTTTKMNSVNSANCNGAVIVGQGNNKVHNDPNKLLPWFSPQNLLSKNHRQESPIMHRLSTPPGEHTWAGQSLSTPSAKRKEWLANPAASPPTPPAYPVPSVKSTREMLRCSYAKRLRADLRNGVSRVGSNKGERKTYQLTATELESKFHTPTCIRELSKLLVLDYGSGDCFPLGVNAWYFPCLGISKGYARNPVFPNETTDSSLPVTACTFFSIRCRRSGSGEVFCPTCQPVRFALLRKPQRRVTVYKRKQSVKYLTPPEAKRRCTEQQREIRNLKRRVHRLLSRLAEEKKKFVVSTGSSVHKVVTDAVSFIKKNFSSSRSEILEVLVRLEIGGDPVEGELPPDSILNKCNECADFILESIRNMSLTLKGKSNLCQYSPTTVNTALRLFLRSRKGYDELRDAKVLCFPCPRKLRGLCTEMRVEEGGDANIYKSLQRETELSGRGELVGHLMMDEIKLKNGIAYNSNSKKIVGFVDDGFDLRALYNEVLSQEEDDVTQHPESVSPTGEKSEDTKDVYKTPCQDKQSASTTCKKSVPPKLRVAKKSVQKNKSPRQLAVYANQWRFRSTNGVVHNGDFFYNTGSLTGSEIARQFLTVVSSYEFVGCRILGLVSDAGGGNTGFFRIMRKGVKVSGPWPETPCISFRNPVQPSIPVFYWTCSTHGLKAARNSLQKSGGSGVRDFIRGGVRFGWPQLREAYYRDENRRKQQKEPPRTDLVFHSIFLDKYTVMNCRYAKAAFSEKTIAEMIRHAAQLLNLSVDVVSFKGKQFESQWHKFVYLCKLLKDKCKESNADESVKSVICTIEFQTAVYGIYIERLMNSKWKLTRDNIAREKTFLRDALEFFSDWRSEREELERKHAISRGQSAKHYPAEQTLENMILTVAGFVGYSEQVLKLCDWIVYIPGLHSNQSSLEAFFSFIRQMDRDRTDKFGGGVLQQNLLNAFKGAGPAINIVGNDMYPKETIADERPPRCEDENEQEEEEGDFSAVRNEVDIGVQAAVDDRESSTILPSRYQPGNCAFGETIGKNLALMTLDENDSFQDWCRSDTRFGRYHKLSRRTVHKKWFDGLILQRNRTQLVNELCQSMLHSIVELMEESIKSKVGRATFEYQVVEWLQSDGLKGCIETYEKGVVESGNESYTSNSNKVCYCILLGALKEKLVTGWIPRAVEAWRRQQKNVMAPQTNQMIAMERINDENVNRYVGWALHGVVRKLKKQHSTNPTDKLQTEIKILEDMTVAEEQILGDVNYIRCYYPMDDLIRNKGRLTLVSPPYIRQFSLLSRYLTREITLERLRKHTDGSLKDHILKAMIVDGTNNILQEVVGLSAQRVPSPKTMPEKGGDKEVELIDKRNRETLLLQVFEKLLNAGVGKVIGEYRDTTLKGKNDFSFRTTLGVLSNRDKK